MILLASSSQENLSRWEQAVCGLPAFKMHRDDGAARRHLALRQRVLVDVVDGEEGGRLGELVGTLDGAVDLSLGGRGVERPLEGQDNLDAGRVNLQSEPRWVGADFQRRDLHGTDEVEDAAVLQPDLVVEKAAQLL